MSRRTGSTTTLVLITFLLVACGDDVPEQPTEWHEAEGHRWRELAVPEDGRAGFQPLDPSRTGIQFENAISDERLMENQNLADGSGVAIGDVDGDGLADVYLARLEGPNALYLNQGGWHFEDVASDAGVAAPDRFSTGATMADVDGDGDLDLVVTALGQPNALFLNEGDGTFTDASGESGIAEGERGSTTTALADVDGDGDLDLYVANYKAVSVNDLYSPEERSLSRTVGRQGGHIVVAPEFREHYAVEWRGNELYRYEIGEPDDFYLNDGEGGFERVELTSGRFLDSEGQPLGEAPPDWGLAARFQDLDGDGDQDLYVCNDFESPDRLWLNDGEGRFRASPAEAIRTMAVSCMSVDFADVDGNGALDVFAVDMLSRDRERSRAHLPVVALESSLNPGAELTQQVQRNVLLLGRGDSTYAEAAHYAGVAASGWSWSTMFLDADLDGDQDLLIPNGHLHDVMDADTQVRLMDARLDEWRQHILFYDPLRLRNVAFRNEGGLQFEEVGEAWGFGPEEDISHGIATGDLDGDGDPDAVVNRMGDPALVLRNETVAPRIAVRLEGRPPNTGAVGAVIRVRGGAADEARKEVTAGGLYLSSSEPLYAFGTADAEEVEIEVTWPDGATSRVDAARPGRLYVIEEPPSRGQAPGEAMDDRPVAAVTPPATPATPVGPDAGAGERASGGMEAPVFERIDPGPDHLHVDLPYGDFERQPLLPWRLSTLGPGVTWNDVDGDGDPDLLVASGRGGTLSLFRNDDGAFRRVVLRTQEAPLDQTTVLPLPGDGGTTLLVGQMNYEASDPGTASRAPSVLRTTVDRGELSGEEAVAEVQGVVPGQPGGVGPLAAADYDDDGDLDLFVGGRARPAAYPARAASRLFLNDGSGEFRLDAANAGDDCGDCPLDAVTMASGAVFSDVDADGDPDLLVAESWGPIRLLINEDGRFRDATESWGLSEETNLWNGITTGDLNGDGRLDIVATARGLNTGLRASHDRPLRMWGGDLDSDGTSEALVGEYDEDLGGYSSLVGFQRLRSALPGVVEGRIESYSEYAAATVEEVLEEVLSRAEVLEANRLDHVAFLNRGDRFEPVPLPPTAQLAPAFHVAVADYDGDGHEDVFLAQNFSGTDPETAAHRAGRGLWLRGDGEGGLRPVSGRESGVVAYGDGRGAALADYDADGRVDLALSQHGRSLRLFRNRSADPGLRVRLIGPAGNPNAVGAAMWLVYEDGGTGPVREVKAGSGYWSADAPVQVLGRGGTPSAVRVRWPGGRETEHSVPAEADELRISAPGSS